MVSSPDAEAGRVAERYRRFATQEAPGRSDVYEEWARGVAADPDAQRLLARIPEGRRQPPLVFAVTRMLGATEGGYAAWSQWLHFSPVPGSVGCRPSPALFLVDPTDRPGQAP